MEQSTGSQNTPSTQHHEKTKPKRKQRIPPRCVLSSRSFQKHLSRTHYVQRSVTGDKLLLQGSERKRFGLRGSDSLCHGWWALLTQWPWAIRKGMDVSLFPDFSNYDRRWQACKWSVDRFGDTWTVIRTPYFADPWQSLIKIIVLSTSAIQWFKNYIWQKKAEDKI